MHTLSLHQVFSLKMLSNSTFFKCLLVSKFLPILPYPLVSEANREVADLTERKNPRTCVSLSLLFLQVESFYVLLYSSLKIG